MRHFVSPESTVFFSDDLENHIFGKHDRIFTILFIKCTSAQNPSKQVGSSSSRTYRVGCNRSGKSALVVLTPP